MLWGASSVLRFQGGSFIVSSYRGHLLRLIPDGSGRISQRAVQQGQGVLSGLGRRVSSLFGLRSPPADTIVSISPVAPPTSSWHTVVRLVVTACVCVFQVHSVLYAQHSGALYTLSTCGLNKWDVGDATEVQVLSWNASPVLTESISDAIWVRGRERGAR